MDFEIKVVLSKYPVDLLFELATMGFEIYIKNRASNTLKTADGTRFAIIDFNNSKFEAYECCFNGNDIVYAQIIVDRLFDNIELVNEFVVRYFPK